MSRRSLTGRLSVLFTVATLLVGALAVLMSYERGLTEARGLQDDVLVQVAALAAGTGVPATSTDQRPLTDAASDIDVTTLSESGLTNDPGRGLHTITVSGEPRRVVVVARPGAPSVVVSQALSVRDELARSAALSAALPLAVLLPLLLLVIVLGLRWHLAPVDRLAREVQDRDAGDLYPLRGERLPSELAGFIAALNRLLARVSDAQERERTFVAQAAHELRTPLTATSLQLERATVAVDPAVLRTRLSDIRGGVDRTRHLVDQLLALARAQSSAAGALPAREPFDVLLRATVGEVLHLADQRVAVIEVPTGGNDHTEVPAAEFGAALRNVIDNALRYGPQGGTVSIRAVRDAGRFVVAVDDEGPGVADPASVVRPFVREAGQSTAGSGLGLAIALEQLRRVGGRLELGRRPDRSTGLRVVLSVPLCGVTSVGGRIAESQLNASHPTDRNSGDV